MDGSFQKRNLIKLHALNQVTTKKTETQEIEVTFPVYKKHSTCYYNGEYRKTNGLK
jgi:hypothetical protein